MAAVTILANLQIGHCIPAACTVAALLQISSFHPLAEAFCNAIQAAAFTLLDACSRLAPHQLPAEPKRQGAGNGWRGPSACRPRIQLQFPPAKPAANSPGVVLQRPSMCTSSPARNLAPEKQPAVIANPLVSHASDTHLC